MNEAIALIAVGGVVLVAAAPVDASPGHSSGKTADQPVTEPG
jgi:hypothetical protein